MTEDPPPDASNVEPAEPPLGESHGGSSKEGRPAFYAARAGGWRDWWTLLHPPYTAWHLAYVVIGACLAPTVSATRLVATLLAFFFAVGLAAHSLDELNGRPLGTRIPARALVAVTVVGLAAAVALGIAGLTRVDEVAVVDCIGVTLKFGEMLVDLKRTTGMRASASDFFSARPPAARLAEVEHFYGVDRFGQSEEK